MVNNETKILCSKNDLLKHTAFIHISNILTLLQRKISNLLLKNAFSNLESKEAHHIKISEITNRLGIDSNNYEHIKESLRALNRTQIEWNVLGKDKKNEWGVSTILASVEFLDGICRYTYSLPIREKLKNPNIYARLNLLVQKKFRSKYSLALWEFLTEFLGKNDIKKVSTEWIDIEDFKKILGIQKISSYNNLRDLQKRIIKPSIKEINEESDIKIEIGYKKESRRIVAFMFYVQRKDGYQPMLDFGVTKQEKKDRKESINEHELIKEYARLRATKNPEAYASKIKKEIELGNADIESIKKVVEKEKEKDKKRAQLKEKEEEEERKRKEEINKTSEKSRDVLSKLSEHEYLELKEKALEQLRKRKIKIVEENKASEGLLEVEMINIFSKGVNNKILNK